MRKTIKLLDGEEQTVDYSIAYECHGIVAYEGHPYFVTGLEPRGEFTVFQLSPVGYSDMNENMRHELFAQSFIQDVFG